MASRNSSPLSKKLSNVHILILDSSAHATGLLKDMLSEFGFTGVFVANSGFQGVQILRKKKIHLIIMDWELKVPYTPADGEDKIQQDILPVSGVDFVKRLRRSPSSPNPYTPIILFASNVEVMLVNAARDAGANEICIKPVSARGLAEKIIAVIERPRIFITSESYKGPCRRLSQSAVPVQSERRKMEIRVIKFNRG